MSEKQIVVKGNYQIASPSQMVGMAKVLKQHIMAHKLYTPIVGKNYVQVEGWMFAGGLMGLFPRVVAVDNLSSPNELRWKAEVEIFDAKTDKVVGRGFALCSNKESKKKTFDEYAVMSMAQTRAIGKAYRNLIGWVMKLSGYEATPSEEMFKMGETPAEVPVQPVAGKPMQKPVVKVPEHECSVGAEIISQQEYDYSKRIFGKALCREHQKSARAKK